MSDRYTHATSSTPSRGVLKDISVLIGGTAGAQVLAVASAPILARLYSPADFGALAVFLGFGTVLASVSALRYEQAIALPRTDQGAFHVVVICLLLTLFTAALCLLIGPPCLDAVRAYTHQPAAQHWANLFPFLVVILGIHQSLYYWHVRTRRFGLIASARIAQTVGMLLVQVAAYKLGGMGLAIGVIVGYATGTAYLARRDSWPSKLAPMRQRAFLYALKRYRRFPLIDSWSGLMNAVSMQLPILLFAALFDATSAGVFALAQRVLAQPITIVGQSTASVFLSRAASSEREEDLRRLVEQTHKSLSRLSMPFFLAIVIAGPELFGFFFGPEWQWSGEFARWMAPWLWCVFVTAPLSSVHSLLEKQTHGAAFQAVLLSVRGAALITGGRQGDPMLAIALFSIGSAVCWLGLLLWIFAATGVKTKQVLAADFTELLINCLVLAPLAATSWLLSPRWHLLLVLLLFSVACVRQYCWLRAAVLSPHKRSGSTANTQPRLSDAA